MPDRLTFQGGGKPVRFKKRINFKLKEILKIYSPFLKPQNPQKAFSIAEAMVTLLIVSVAMAAMAPIISKRAKNEIQSDSTPSGAVMFFDRDSCPPGWTNISQNWQGRFPRFAGNYTICDNEGETNGNCTNEEGARINVTDNTRGKLAGDSMRPVFGTAVTSTRSKIYEINGVFQTIYRSWWGIGGGGSSGDEQGINFDISRQVPVDNEIRPKSVTLLGCRKN